MPMHRRADGTWSRGPYRDNRWGEPRQRSPLKEARLRADLTQAELAEALGINRSQLAGYESGWRRHPSGDRRRAIEEFIAAVAAGGAVLKDWLAGYRGG